MIDRDDIIKWTGEAVEDIIMDNQDSFVNQVARAVLANMTMLLQKTYIVYVVTAINGMGHIIEIEYPSAHSIEEATEMFNQDEAHAGYTIQHVRNQTRIGRS